MNSPKESLEARGIAAQALLAGWTEQENYWRYSVINPQGETIAEREKRFPFADTTKHKAKVRWHPSKPTNPDSEWYILGDTIQAIQSANGVCYLANGEPAMLSYRAAGILNAIATTLSEIAVPKNLLAYLRLIGVNHLIYIVDKDAAGLRSAVNWRDALAGSGIHLTILVWPDSLPEKADSNDAWITAKFDSKTFFEILDSCYTPDLPLLETKVVKPYVATEFDKSSLVAALHNAMSNAGKLERKIYQGTWQECHCPFHEDDKASAGFNIENGVINCMGRCGKTFSSKEVAIHFGIDWKSFYPKREGKKKPLKADLSRFEEALDTIPDVRSYEDILTDEISARMQAYEAGQYLGFGRWQALPLGILGAVLSLCNGRSNTAVFLGRLLDALVTGKLPSVFNYEMAMKALQLPYKTVFKGCFELSALSFLPKLSGIKRIDSMLSIETGKNSDEGRPCDWFMVEFESEEIKSLLIKQLEIHFLEKYCGKALALPTMAMASAYGLNEAQALEYRNRIKEALGEKVNKQAKQAYDAEMFGDGKWGGWYKAIDSEVVAPLDYSKFKDVCDLRAALMQWWTSKKRAVNSREELCRLLGCSDASLDKVFERANITSDRQQTKVEFQVPETVRQMAYLWGKNQRDLQGKCWKGGFKLKGEKEWMPVDEKDYLKTFASFAGRIEKAYMLIITPSKQRPMTEDEIATRDAAQALAQEAQEKALQAPKEGKTEKQGLERQERYKAPDFGKHSYPFLYRQLQLLFHVYTDYKLGNKQAIVFDKDDKPVHSGQLPALKTFFLSVASDTPKRTVRSFYGKSYNEAIDFAELEALADSQRAKFTPIASLNAVIELEEIEDLPVQMEMIDAQAPKKQSIPPLPVVQAKVKHVEKAWQPVDWTTEANSAILMERFRILAGG